MSPHTDLMFYLIALHSAYCVLIELKIIECTQDPTFLSSCDIFFAAKGFCLVIHIT